MQKVLVTTLHRGVFFGELVSNDLNAKRVVLRNARAAIYWATKGGFFELASVGPNGKSIIGSIAPEVTLHDVTSIVVCSPGAIRAWEQK
jgi:phosphatidylserine decarboxylase